MAKPLPIRCWQGRGSLSEKVTYLVLRQGHSIKVSALRKYSHMGFSDIWTIRRMQTPSFQSSSSSLPHEPFHHHKGTKWYPMTAILIPQRPARRGAGHILPNNHAEDWFKLQNPLGSFYSSSSMLAMLSGCMPSSWIHSLREESAASPFEAFI